MPMQNFLEFSSVVDSVRSNAGSAIKNVQRSFEEHALKAAGLGEDEEALYRLNKRAQAYLRAADALQQAAAALVEDFSEAIEDLEMRAVVRKFRDSHKSVAAKHMVALNRELAEPVRQAHDGSNHASRQPLIMKAFQGLLDTNLDCFRVASALVHEVRALNEQTNLKSQKIGSAPTEASRRAPAPVGYPAVRQSPDAPVRHESTPSVPAPARGSQKASFEDLLGEADDSSGSTATGGSKGNDLLDFDFGSSGMPNGSNNARPQPTTPFVSDGAADLFSSSVPNCIKKSEPGSYVSADLFDAFASSNSGACPTAAPVQTANGNKANDPFGLSDLSWAKEDEDESCIRERVKFWQNGKNIRTMLISLHEVAPSSSGWVPVKLDDVQSAAGVKSAYRKAVLAVHPDKHQTGKTGEKILGHLVFDALRDQWNVFRANE